MHIRKLDSKTADQIAAGEVVENPSSLVKELVENSLDAGAKQIKIILKKGGLQEITVIDDGLGIPSQEITLALERHATSKITCPEDLQKIRTLGFRGEALPSIASVSRLSLTSRHKDEESGIYAYFEGGREKTIEEVGFTIGTKVTVNDLFYNTPVRLRFLKSIPAETAKITKTLHRLALSRPDVSFALSRENELLLETTGDGCLLNVIVKIYGSTLGRELVELNFNTSGLVLNGFISNSSYSRRSRNLQAFFVNQRYVQSPLLSKTLERSFARIVTAKRYPAAFLFLNLPPADVDVNVHPNKTEVRFRHEDAMQHFLEQSLHAAFSPGYRLSGLAPKSVKKTKPLHQRVLTEQHETVKEKSTAFSINSSLQDNLNNKIMQLPPNDPDNNSDKVNTFFKPPIENIFDGFILGQVFGTYIVLVKDDELIFVDQHAAHERIIWEELQLLEKEKKRYVQTILPLTLELTPLIAEEFRGKMELFKDIGLEIEPFGHNTFIIRTVPFFIKDVFSTELIRDIFEDLSHKALVDREFIKETLLQLACKASIKANQALTPEGIKSLLEQLEKCANPFFCPHGRPVMFKLTKAEMEKQFKRRG